MDELAEDPVWRSIAKVCMAVALIAVLFNMTTQWELEGHFQTWSFVRKSIAKVVSSGTVWAGVAVYAGWKLSRPTVAFLGGIVASVATLFIHYVVGGVLDFVTGWVIHLDGTNDLLGNLNWFAAAALLCGPLGLVGWMAAKPSGAGAVARCVVPVGALLEPFVMGCFSAPFMGPSLGRALLRLHQRSLAGRAWAHGSGVGPVAPRSRTRTAPSALLDLRPVRTRTSRKRLVANARSRRREWRPVRPSARGSGGQPGDGCVHHLRGPLPCPADLGGRSPRSQRQKRRPIRTPPQLSDKIHYDISRGWTALPSAESSIISPPLHRAGLTIFPTIFTTPVPAAQPPAAQHRAPVQPSGNCPCNQQQILNTPAKPRARQQFPPTTSASLANDRDPRAASRSAHGRYRSTLHRVDRPYLLSRCRARRDHTCC